MKKRYKIIIGIITIIGLIASSKWLMSLSDSSETTLVDSFTDENTISIIMPYNYYTSKQDSDVVAFVQKTMFKIYGVERLIKINVVDLSSESYEDYIMKRNNYLFQKNGPELIWMSSDDDDFLTFIEQGIALPVNDKIPGLEHVYAPLRHDYFVPIGMSSQGAIANVRLLKEVDAPLPTFDWTLEDFEKIQKVWTQSYNVSMDLDTFVLLYLSVFADTDFIDSVGNVNLETDEIVEKIKRLRDLVYDGDYQVDYTKTFEDYKIVTNTGRNYGRNRKIYWLKTQQTNLLHPLNNYYETALEENLLLPDLLYQKGSFVTAGFFINYNGKNIDLAYDVLNALLLKPSQEDLYNKRLYYAPVTDEVEDLIKSGDVIGKNVINISVSPAYIDIWERILLDLDAGEYHPYEDRKLENLTLDSLFETSGDIIFQKTYMNDEDIRRQLRNLENYIYINMNE